MDKGNATPKSKDAAVGPGRGAPTQAESVFERTDGIVRFKLGPASSSFAAGMSEPSLPPMAPAGYGGPLRPLGEVEKKTVYQYPGSRSENPLPGHAGANRDRHE